MQFWKPDAFSFCTTCKCYVNLTEIIQNIDCWAVLAEAVNDNKCLANGDGICDDVFNNVNHFFDTGDCCIDESSPKCQLSNAFCNTETMGDGICQDYNNGPKCDYDLGDCCSPIRGEECCLCQCKNWVYTGHDFQYLAPLG